MSYLAKLDRKALILNAAIDITLKEGLETLTARNVTAYAEMSIGQIYHHYKSISELRAEVFKTISNQYLQESQHTTLNAYDLLQFMLMLDESEDIRIYLKLWRDAEKLIEKDELLSIAYQQAIHHWHNLLIKALDKGVSENLFIIKSGSAKDSAWRLIAVAFGLERILTSNSSDLDINSANDYLKMFINNEIQIK